MNIFELRTITKLSQSQFAKKYNIPVRTLQKWEQGASNPPAYLISLIKDDISNEQFFDVQKFLIKKVAHKFKIVIKNTFKNISKIHPIQQQRVYDIIEELKKYESVEKIVIFGSSVTSRCTYESDLDIYVVLNKMEKVKTYSIDCPVDFWTNFTIDESMNEEIKSKGVVVYER